MIRPVESNPRVVVLTAEELVSRSRRNAIAETLPTWEREIYAFVNQWKDSTNDITLRTSGTTGQPRDIKVAKSRMEHSAKLTGRWLGLKTGSTALLCLPVDYVAGKMMLVRVLTLNLTLVAVEPTSRPLEGLDRPLDLAAMVPLQLEKSLNHKAFRLIRTLLVGGAPVTVELKNRVRNTPVQVIETYGMTETLSHVAYRYLNGPEYSDTFQALEGVAFEQTKEGCLIVRAPDLNPEPVITRDLVELLSRESFLWLGRADHVINSGGIKIIPEEVEQKLANEMKSRPFFIAGFPDKQVGQKVVLIVEGKADLPGDYRLGQGLDRYGKPREIIYLKSFQYTESGKINRKETIRYLIKSLPV
jgi:O-succinylbenzoic acid--CoA ligase